MQKQHVEVGVSTRYGTLESIENFLLQQKPSLDQRYHRVLPCSSGGGEQGALRGRKRALYQTRGHANSVWTPRTTAPIVTKPYTWVGNDGQPRNSG